MNKSFKWSVQKMPIIGTGKKVLVLDGAFRGAGVALMAEAGFTRATSVDDADVVLFMGGADISPALYHDKNIRSSFDAARDAFEVSIYHDAVAKGKILLGICRGAQFLHAMNGGKLWQHVEGHAGYDHVIYDMEEDCELTVNSLHHQMLIDNEDLRIIALCKDQVSRKFFADGNTVDLDKEGNNSLYELEIEAGAYDKTKCFFVQGHPEVGSPPFRSWFMHKFGEFIDLHQQVAAAA